MRMIGLYSLDKNLLLSLIRVVGQAVLMGWESEAMQTGKTCHAFSILHLKGIQCTKSKVIWLHR